VVTGHIQAVWDAALTHVRAGWSLRTCDSLGAPAWSGYSEGEKGRGTPGEEGKSEEVT
jgi:hypothetical protein